MPLLVYKDIELRDPDRVRDWGLALVQMCRVHRGRPGVVSARYWINGLSTATILVEMEPGVSVNAGMEAPEFGAAQAGLAQLARSGGLEVWADAAGAANALTQGGR